MSAAASPAEGIGATADHGGETAPAGRYRLLHSTGERLLADRRAALAILAALPGAKLFVLAA